MEILRFNPDDAEPIGQRPYDVQLASLIKLAQGEGEAHVYLIYLAPGGEIEAHEAGFGQIFLAVKGSGWVAADDGVHITLREGHAAFIQRGEVHAKGSESGMTALMMQVRNLTPPAL